jgi:S1-C subfamily serine protease
LFGSCLPGNAEVADWRVNFQTGSGSVESAAVAMPTADGPILVAVAQHGADFAATTLVLEGKQVAAKFVGYDAVSRLCIFKPSEPIKGVLLEWAKKTPEEVGTRITVGTGAARRTGILTGKVNLIGRKVLPFALFDVELAGDAPEAGTSVIGPDGKVVGIICRAGAAASDLYVIPTQAIHRVVADVLVNKKLVRGWLGLSLMVGTAEPRITKVWSNSPAADAGLREGDLITKIGKTEVREYADVSDTFFYLIPGKSVEVTVSRGGEIFRFALSPTTERPN